MAKPAWSRYWNPKNETMERTQLQSLQLIKLQQNVQRAYERSPFHRRLYEQAGVKPEQIRSLDDIRRLPFMTREAWMANQAEAPLFGDLVRGSLLDFRIHVPPSSRTCHCHASQTPSSTRSSPSRSP